MLHGRRGGNRIELGEAPADGCKVGRRIGSGLRGDAWTDRVELRGLAGEGTDGAGATEIGMGAHQVGLDPADEHGKRRHGAVRGSGAGFVQGQKLLFGDGAIGHGCMTRDVAAVA